MYTLTLSSKCVFCKFFLIISVASFDLSHNTTFFAPLLTASIPIAPLPENKSKKVLTMFKTDVEGNVVPVQMNILQKMSQSVSTMARKVAYRKAIYKHRSIKRILATAAITAGALYAGKRAIGSVKTRYRRDQNFASRVNDQMNRYATDPMSRAGVDAMKAYLNSSK